MWTSLKLIVFSTILQDVLPKISSQFESLKPHFTKIDRLEDLITRVNCDLEAVGINIFGNERFTLNTNNCFIEKQLEVAEGSVVEEGTLKNVLKMPLNLFNKQPMEGSQSSTSISSQSRPAFSPHPIFKTEAFFSQNK